MVSPVLAHVRRMVAIATVKAMAVSTRDGIGEEQWDGEERSHYGDKEEPRNKSEGEGERKMEGDGERCRGEKEVGRKTKYIQGYCLCPSNEQTCLSAGRGDRVAI